NTIFSPHIAGVTIESQQRFLTETIANVLRYIQGLEPLYRVL
ncbi:MAG: hydroxyacid dehydrogenase, partial [Thermoplasmata archaeon]|nr:hydroxyacid dehydrogenase [Thermoplasmata archaeon]